MRLLPGIASLFPPISGDFVQRRLLQASNSRKHLILQPVLPPFLVWLLWRIAYGTGGVSFCLCFCQVYWNIALPKIATSLSVVFFSSSRYVNRNGLGLF